MSSKTNKSGVGLMRIFERIKHPLPSMIWAQISAPTPNWGQPPSTVSRWLVFITLVSMHSTSMGRMVRRLITWWGQLEGEQTECCHLLAVNGRTDAPLYLTLDALLGEDGGSIQAVTHVPRVADQSHVSPWNKKNSLSGNNQCDWC